MCVVCRVYLAYKRLFDSKERKVPERGGGPRTFSWSVSPPARIPAVEVDVGARARICCVLRVRAGSGASARWWVVVGGTCLA
jgi:hypothetical protein